MKKTYLFIDYRQSLDGKGREVIVIARMKCKDFEEALKSSNEILEIYFIEDEAEFNSAIDNCEVVLTPEGREYIIACRNASNENDLDVFACTYAELRHECRIQKRIANRQNVIALQPTRFFSLEDLYRPVMVDSNRCKRTDSWKDREKSRQVRPSFRAIVSRAKKIAELVAKRNSSPEFHAAIAEISSVLSQSGLNQEQQNVEDVSV